MGLRIGGSLGPLRLGISTRGIGGGVGPFSAGTSWRRRGKSDGTVPALFWLAIIAFILVAWPYTLGTWAAVKLGAPPDSAARSVTGWTLEVIYVLGLVWLVLTFLNNLNRARAAQDLEERRQAAQAAARVSQDLVRRLRANPCGGPDPALPASRRLLMRFDDASLVEPRPERRGGPRVPTKIANGYLLVTDHELMFVGPERSVKWRYDKIFDMHTGSDFVTFNVTNRQLVSGVSVGTARLYALLLTVRWGSAVASDSELTDIEVAARQLKRDDAAALAAIVP